jgi:hypothetical protein
MMADPRNLYDSETFNAPQISLDTGVGYGGLTQSMKYTWPSRAQCTDFSIGRNLTLPSNVPELWLEVYARFSSGFTTQASGCGGQSNPDYKFLFGRITGMSSRFEIVLGNGGSAIITGYPGNEEAVRAAITTTSSGIWQDDAWHRFRFHWKIGSGTGAMEAWIDGTKIANLTGVSTGSTTGIYGVAMGRNMNQGPTVSQSLWWGRVAIYNSNPGW